MTNIDPSQNNIIISSGSSIMIEKLKGVCNYTTWKFQMKLLLIENGLWDFANGLVQASTDNIKDQRAYAKICLNIQPICYPHVRNAKTAEEAWNNLKTAYENVGISRRLSLKRKLAQIKYADYSCIDHYLGDIISVTQELADIGCIIEDEELAELMLIGLPSEFDALIMAMEATSKELKSDFVKSQLMQYEFKKES